MSRRRVVIETSCLSTRPDRLVRTGIQEVQHRLLLELPRLRRARPDLELLAAPLPAPCRQATPGILDLIAEESRLTTAELWGPHLGGGALSVEQVVGLWAAADVVHLQSFIADPEPLLDAVARRPGSPRVTALIYDAIPLLFPEYLSEEILLEYKAFERCVRRRAERLICISRHTALDALELLTDGGPSPRVVFVTLPDAPRLEGDAAVARALRERFGLRSGEYVVALGTIEPRKGLERLLEGFERYLERPTARPLQLVLVGGGGWKDQTIRARLAASPARERIVETGYLEEAHLAALMGEACTLAMLSMYEGFGLPVAQARAAGLVPLVAAGSSLPEAAPGGCVQVDPWDPDSVAAGLALVAEARAALPVRGRDWSAWADELLDTLAPPADAAA